MQLEDLVVCPRCRGDLLHEPQSLRCVPCGHTYPLVEGVALLAVGGTSETWAAEEPATPETSRPYQDQYVQVEAAEEYNREYEEKLFKRMSTAREFRLLEQQLASQGEVETILDLPCGGGRLSPQIAPFTRCIIEADIAEGQVLYGKQTSRLEVERIWMTASAFHIPLRDASVDGVVCCRLCHHLPTAEERERLVAELLRVAKRFVIMTFFDYHSPKNLMRRMRRPFNHKPPKMTMTVARVRELARLHGGELVAWPALAYFNSGHRYALIEKRQG